MKILTLNVQWENFKYQKTQNIENIVKVISQYKYDYIALQEIDEEIWNTINKKNPRLTKRYHLSFNLQRSKDGKQVGILFLYPKSNEIIQEYHGNFIVELNGSLNHNPRAYSIYRFSNDLVILHVHFPHNYEINEVNKIKGFDERHALFGSIMGKFLTTQIESFYSPEYKNTSFIFCGDMNRNIVKIQSFWDNFKIPNTNLVRGAADFDTCEGQHFDHIITSFPFSYYKTYTTLGSEYGGQFSDHCGVFLDIIVPPRVINRRWKPKQYSKKNKDYGSILQNYKEKIQKKVSQKKEYGSILQNYKEKIQKKSQKKEDGSTS